MSNRIEINTDAAAALEKHFGDFASRINGALSTLNEAEAACMPGIGHDQAGQAIRGQLGPASAGIRRGTEDATTGTLNTGTGLRTTVNGFTHTENGNLGLVPGVRGKNGGML